LKYDFARPENDKRRSAIVKAFQWMTGYNSLDEAAHSKDKRCFTGQGLCDLTVEDFEDDELICQEE